MKKRIQELIDLIGLVEHPEGGYFKETYRSPLIINSPHVNAQRSAVTDIYFMLVKGQFSRFHQVKHDEIWNFYEGAPLLLYDYDPDTQHLRSFKLGSLPGCDGFKTVIQANHWQAAESLGEYTLVGCTVAPGFDFHDFRLLDADNEVKQDVIKRHPELQRFF